MTDLEDRLRSTLASWADDAPPPLGWSPDMTAVESPPPDRRIVTARWLAVAAAVAVALVTTLLAAREDQEPLVTGGGLLRADLAVGDTVGVRVLAIDRDTGVLFVASENDARVYRIDPQTEAVTPGPSLWARDVVGAAGGSVYVLLDDPVRVARLDGETFEELASAEIAGTPISVRPISGRLWVRTAERELVLMDLTTLEARPEVPFDHGAGFLAQGPAGVWLTDFDAGEVAQVDPETGATLATVEVEGARGIAVGDDAVWVTIPDLGRVMRVDADTGKVDVVAPGIGRRPSAVTVDGDLVWVTTFGDGRLTGIDATTGEVVTSVPVGLRPGGIVVAGDSVWVSVHQRASVLRLDREHLRSTGVTTPAWTDSSVDAGDGAQLVLRCMGRGDSTVVLMPRDGADLGEWAYVQPELARSTRACAYEPPTDREHEEVDLPAAELATLVRAALRDAGASGPFVVVGSQGGSSPAGAFGEAYGDEAIGLVLVDPGRSVPSSIEASTGLPLRVVAEDLDGPAGRVPSAPQRQPARVVDAILRMLATQ